MENEKIKDQENENSKPVVQQLERKVPSLFSNKDAFDEGQRIAIALSKSDLVPKTYHNNVPNCMIALEMSNRMNVAPLMVMQNLDIIQGKPSWSSTFIISAINTCGRFKPLRFSFEGGTDASNKNDDYGCRAYTYDLETGEKLVSPLVNWKMVKAEGWLNKKGSKWQTMPELMFQYRCASFFGRLYCPDILKGMHSVEEVIDIGANAIKIDIKKQKLEKLNSLYENESLVMTEDEKLNIERIIDQKEHLSYDKAIQYLEEKLKSNK